MKVCLISLFRLFLDPYCQPMLSGRRRFGRRRNGRGVQLAFLWGWVLPLCHEPPWNLPLALRIDKVIDVNPERNHGRSGVNMKKERKIHF